MTTVVAISEYFGRVCCMKRNTSDHAVLVGVTLEVWRGKFTVNSSQWAESEKPTLESQGKGSRRLAGLLRMPRTPALTTVHCSL